MEKYLNLRANIALWLIFAFLLNTFGPLPLAQADPASPAGGDLVLPKPGVMVHLSPEFNPPILKGIKVHPDNPFRFDFILDQGDTPSLVKEGDRGSLKQQATKLIKYFLASLTIPEKDLWVNLSPYEKDRIIPNSFGLTEMGRDLLAQDYMLKQITASLIYPEDRIGKSFWKRIYQEASRKFGTTNIPVNTFNKVWIVPQKAVVYENTSAKGGSASGGKAATAYVVESKLKVMLEQDYLAMSKHADVGVAEGGASPSRAQAFASTAGETRGQDPNINALGSQIIREIVIPELTKEVNQGKNFAQLRQVYNSLILATWYKKKIKDSILAQVYADKNKVAGVNYDKSVIQQNTVILSETKDLKASKDSSPPKSVAGQNDVEGIYQRYLQAFKKGVYNYIKEDQDPLTQQVVPRKYFSGGFDGEHLWDVAMIIVNRFPDRMMKAGNFLITTNFAMANQPAKKILKRIDKAMKEKLLQRVIRSHIFSAFKYMRFFVKNKITDTRSFMKVLTKKSKGVYNYENLEESIKLGPKGYALGINDFSDEQIPRKYLNMTSKIGFLNYVEAAKYVRVDPSDTKDLIQALIDEKKPIVFFVPTNVMGWKGHTFYELETIFEDFPNDLQNFYFVFGLYDSAAMMTPGKLSQVDRDSAQLTRVQSKPKDRVKTNEGGWNQKNVARVFEPEYIKQLPLKIELSNITKGGPPVLLSIKYTQFSPGEGMYSIKDYIDSQELDGIDLDREKEKDGTIIYEINDFYPIGNFNKPINAQWTGQGISSTILKWLAWTAKQNNAEMRNLGTRTFSLIRLYRRFFANDIRSTGKLNEWVNIKNIIKTHGGFFDESVAGRLWIGEGQSNDIAVNVTALAVKGRPDIYQIEDQELKTGKNFNLPGIVKIDEQGVVWTEDGRQRVGKVIYIDNTEVRGKPRSVQIPGIKIIKTVNSAQLADRAMADSGDSWSVFQTLGGHSYHALHEINEDSWQNDETALAYSYMKFGEPRVIKHFAEQLVKRIRKDLWDKINKDKSHWIVVNPAGDMVPNTSFLLAKNVADALGLPHVSLSQPKNKILQESLARTKDVRLTVNGSEVKDQRAILSNRKVIFIDDGVFTGMVLDFDLPYLRTLGAQDIVPYLVARLKGNGLFERSVDLQILQRFGVQSLAKILNDQEAVYTTRMIKYALELREHQFDELLESLNLDAKINLYLYAVSYFGDHPPANIDKIIDSVSSQIAVDLPGTEQIQRISSEAPFQKVIELVQQRNYRVAAKDIQDVAAKVNAFMGIGGNVGIKLVIFDLDRTLNHSAEYYDAVKRATFNILTGRSIPREEAETRINALRQRLAQDQRPLLQHNIADEFGISPQEFDQLVTSQVNAEEYIQADPVLAEQLHRLKAAGKKVAVLTESPQGQAHQILKALGIDDLFDKVFIAGNSGYHKPDPRIFNVVLQHFGVAAGQAIMVGDNKNFDIEPAKKLGMKTILISSSTDIGSIGDKIIREDRAMRNDGGQGKKVKEWKSLKPGRLELVNSLLGTIRISDGLPDRYWTKVLKNERYAIIVEAPDKGYLNIKVEKGYGPVFYSNRPIGRLAVSFDDGRVAVSSKLQVIKLADGTWWQANFSGFKLEEKDAKRVLHLSFLDDDSAMAASANDRTMAKVQRKGGIDFTADKTPLEIKAGFPTKAFGNDSGNVGNDGGGIKFNLTPAMLAQLQNAPGFVPVIISIQPMNDLRQFLEA